MKRSRYLVPLLAVAFLAAGCGGSSTVDGKNLEASIESFLSFAKEGYEARCPETLDKGSTFTCTVTDKEGNSYPVKGEISEEGAFQYNLESVPQTPK